MSALGSLIVKLGLDFAEYTGGLSKTEQATLATAKKVQDTVEGMTSKIAATAGAIAGGLAAAYSINAFKGLLQGVIETGARLDDLRMQTGETVEALSGLLAVGKFNDVDADLLGGAMVKLSSNLAGATEESKGTAKALEALGIKMEDFKRLTPAEQMQGIAKGLADFEDGAGKSAVAVALLGKEGAKMLPFFTDLATVGELQAKMTTEQAAAAANLDDNLVRLQTSGDGWKKELVTGMVPALDLGAQALLDVINGTGGMREEVKRLNADGSIREWTRTAITGITYVADAAQVALRVFNFLGKGIGGLLAGAQLALSGNLKGAWQALSESGQDMLNAFSGQTLGASIRARMDEIGSVGAEAEKAKPKLNFSNVIDKNAKAAKEAKDPVDALLESITKKTAAYQGEIANEEKLTDAQKTAIDVLEQLRSGKVKVSQSESALIGKRLEEMMAAEQQLAVQQRQSASLEQERAARAALVKVTEDSAKSYADGNKAMREEIELIGKTAQEKTRILQSRNQEIILIKKATLAEIERRDNAKETMSREQIALAYEIQQLEERNELLGMKGVAEAADQTNQALRDQFQQTMQQVEDWFTSSFLDMINNGKDGWKAMCKSLKNSFLTMVVKEVYAAFAKPFVVQILGSLMGVGGGAGGITGMGGVAGTGSSLIGTASNMYSAYNTGSSLYTVGSQYFAGTMSAANAAGTVYANAVGGGLDALLATNGAYGTASASSMGLGAMSGAGIGAAIVMAAAYLGGMFKSEKQVGAGLTGELGGDVYGYQLMREGGSLFSGPSYKYIIAEQELAKARAEIEELKKNPELETDGNLTYRMKYLRERVEMLEGKYGSSVDGSQGPIETLQKTYSAIRETVASQAESLGLDGEAVRQMKTVLGLDEIHPDTGGTGLELFGLSEEEAAAKVQEAMEKANEDLARSVLGSMQEVTREITRTYAEIIPVHDEDGNVYENRIWHDVTETVTSMEWVMSEYVREGETAVEALNRISGSLVGVNQVFDMLGADLLSASIASGDWASKLVDAIGGLDALNAAALSYYDRYYSDDEKLTRQVSSVNSSMEGLGFDLRVEDANAIQEFRALVDKAIAAQDEELLASLLNISGQFGQAVDAVAEAAQAHMGELEEAAQAAADALENARSAAMRNLEAATSRALSGIADSKALLVNQRALVNETYAQTKGLFDLLHNSVISLYGSVDTAATMQAEQGREFISQALSAARKTGYLPEKDELSDAINAARAGIDNGAFATQFDRDFEALKLAGELSDLEAITGKQKTVQEQQLDSLDQQIEILDKQAKTLQEQLEYVKELVSNSSAGIDATLSVEAAVQAVLALIDSYLNPETPAGSGAASSGSAGGPTVGAGSVSGKVIKAGDRTADGDYYREVVTGTGSFFSATSGADTAHLNDVNDWLDKYRGTGDVAGMLTEASQSGISMNDISAVMGWGYEDLVDAGDRLGIPRFATGGLFAGGGRMVGELGPEFEVTGPARYWSFEKTKSIFGGSQDDGAVVTALDRVVTAIQRVESNTSALPPLLELTDEKSEGGNADRVEVKNLDALAEALAAAIVKELA